jgi:hypothetical protein
MLDVADVDFFAGDEDQAAKYQYTTLLSNRCCDKDGIPHQLQNAISDDALVSATFAIPGFTIGGDGNAKLLPGELWHMPGFAMGKDDGKPVYYCNCTPKELGVRRKLELMQSVMSHDEAAHGITSGDCPHIQGLESLIHGSLYHGDFHKFLSTAGPLPQGMCKHFFSLVLHTSSHFF